MMLFEAFSAYFKRKRGRYTQADMAAALSRSSIIQNNPTTIHHWEAGKTQPSLEKMIRIIQFFGDEPAVILPCLAYQACGQCEQPNTHFLKKLGFAPRGTLVGSFPLDDPNYYTFSALSSSDKPLLQVILALDRLPSTMGCDAVALQTVSKWVDCPSNIRCVGKLYEQYAGHIIALRIKDEKTFQSWQEFNIKAADLASPHEPHYLRIYSLYGHNRVVISYLFMELLKGIFLGNGHCKAVGGVCATKDGFSLTQSIGLAQSLVIRQNGVKVTFCYGDIASIFQAVGDCTLAHVQKILL